MFSPEDKLRKVLVRVVEDLPYGLIIAEAFLKMHGSSISFAAGGGFEPAPELTCMRVLSRQQETSTRRQWSLQWELRPVRQTVVPGFVSVELDAYAKGAQPHDMQLVVVEPTASYDMETGADLGIVRGEQ